jgi:N-acetylmuramoyl-L-alanine amidase
MSKIAIVVGHNSRARGAVRVTDGVPEFEWNGHLAELIRLHDPANIRVFRREAGGGYSAEIDRVYAATDAWGAACTIELHFNAAADARANGGLTLSSGTDGSLRLAREVRERCAAVLGNTDRGVQVRGRHDRGGRSLWQGRAPAILTEPYFGSNAAECMTADAAKDELAEAIYRGARAFIEAHQNA